MSIRDNQYRHLLQVQYINVKDNRQYFVITNFKPNRMKAAETLLITSSATFEASILVLCANMSLNPQLVLVK